MASRRLLAPEPSGLDPARATNGWRGVARAGLRRAAGGRAPVQQKGIKPDDACCNAAAELLSTPLDYGTTMDVPLSVLSTEGVGAMAAFLEARHGDWQRVLADRHRDGLRWTEYTLYWHFCVGRAAGAVPLPARAVPPLRPAQYLAGARDRGLEPGPRPGRPRPFRGAAELDRASRRGSPGDAADVRGGEAAGAAPRQTPPMRRYLISR
ncbi:DUF6492 family protein [Roseomonas sp. GCM10028921]